MDVEGMTLQQLIQELPQLVQEKTVMNERDLHSVISVRLLNAFNEVGTFKTRTGSNSNGSCDYVLITPEAYWIIEVKYVHQGCLDILAPPLDGKTSYDFKTWPIERAAAMTDELKHEILTRPTNEVFTVRNDKEKGRVISTIRGCVNRARAQCAIYLTSAQEKGFRTKIMIDGRPIKGSILCVYGTRVIYEEL